MDHQINMYLSVSLSIYLSLSLSITVWWWTTISIFYQPPNIFNSCWWTTIIFYFLDNQKILYLSIFPSMYLSFYIYLYLYLSISIYVSIYRYIYRSSNYIYIYIYFCKTLFLQLFEQTRIIHKEASVTLQVSLKRCQQYGNKNKSMNWIQMNATPLRAKTHISTTYMPKKTWPNHNTM